MMKTINTDIKPSGTLFGHILARKRNLAGLTLPELAEMTRLSPVYLEELEQGIAFTPNFDVCYKIAQAINSRQRQGFLVQDLWEAASLDRLSLRSRAADQRLNAAPPGVGAAESKAA